MGYRDTFLNNYEDIEETSSPVTEVSPDGVVTVENHLDLSFLDSSPEMEESKVETKTSGISSTADSEKGYDNSGSSLGEYETDDTFKLGKKSTTDKYTNRMSLKERRAQEDLEKENAKYNIEMPHEDNSRANELQREKEKLEKDASDFSVRTPGEAFEKYNDPVSGAKGAVKEGINTVKTIGSLFVPSTYKKLWNSMSEWVKSDKEDFTINDKTYTIKGQNGKQAASFMEDANDKLRNDDGSLNVNNLLASTLFSEGYKGKNLSITKMAMDKVSTADDTTNFVKDMNENIWDNITPDDVYEMDPEDLAIFAEALMYQNGSSPSRQTMDLVMALEDCATAYDILPEINEIFKEYNEYRNELNGRNAVTAITDLMEDAMMMQSVLNTGGAIKNLANAGRYKRVQQRALKNAKNATGRSLGGYKGTATGVGRRAVKAAKEAGKAGVTALGAAAISAIPEALRDRSVETPELSDTAKANDFVDIVRPETYSAKAKAEETPTSTSTEDEDYKRYGSDEGFESPKDKIIGTSGNMLKLRDKLKAAMKQKYDGDENQFVIGKLMDGEIADEDLERSLKGDAEAIKDMLKTLKEFKKETQPWNLIKSLKERGLQGTINHLVNDVFGGVNTGFVEEIEPLLREMTIELAAEDDPKIERPTEAIENTSEYNLGAKTSDEDEYNKGLKASDDRVKDFIVSNIAKDKMLRSWAKRLRG